MPTNLVHVCDAGSNRSFAAEFLSEDKNLPPIAYT
jgi:hypothetical protein